MLTALIGSTDKVLENHLRGMTERLVTVDRVEELDAALGGIHPAAVLLDLREKAGIPPGLALIRRAFKSAGIIVLVDRLDPQLMLEAVRAGANEFLTAPVTLEDLERAFERVANLPSAAQVKGKVLAFLGAKGGVGTTTLAVNVATAISQISPGRVLVIDLHPSFGEAALFFGAESKFTVSDALENAMDLDDAYFSNLVVHTTAGPDLLASSDRPRAAGSANVPRPWLAIDAQRLQNLLEFAAGRYAHVIVDVPRAGATVESLEPLSAMVIVTNEELPTVRAAGRLVASLRLRYGKERVHVVVGRHDAACEIAQKDIERAIGGPIRSLLPSDYRVAVGALNKGRPFVTDAQTSLAIAVIEFARVLAGIAKRPERVAPRSHSRLRRLTGRR